MRISAASRAAAMRRRCAIARVITSTCAGVTLSRT
jgi:hypothetical protein